MKIFIRYLLISLLVLLVSYDTRAEEAPGNPDYAWLEGKWSGTPALGGHMTIEFHVVNDNEIKGAAWLQVNKGNWGGGVGTRETSVWGKIHHDGLVDIAFGWRRERQAGKVNT